MAYKRNPVGRPPKYKSVEEIQGKIDAYFTACKGHPLMNPDTGEPFQDKYGLVKLRHATYKYGTLETLYAHLSKLCVTQGQQVQEGQLIGYSGDTGNCYGAHLHFEVRWKGQRTNPLNWLDADFSMASGAVKLGSYSSVAHNMKEVEYMNYAIDVSKHRIRCLHHRYLLPCRNGGQADPAGK